MSWTTLGLEVVLVLALGGGTSPVQEAFAYSRETRPGIPAGPGVEAAPGRSLEKTYFIYVVLRVGPVPTEASVWLQGKLYGATLQEVATPVTIEHDPVVPTGEKDTLVPATESPVFQVLLAEERTGSTPDEAEEQLVRDNDAVVVLRTEGSSWRVPIETIEPLAPAPGL